MKKLYYSIITRILLRLSLFLIWVGCVICPQEHWSDILSDLFKEANQ